MGRLGTSHQPLRDCGGAIKTPFIVGEWTEATPDVWSSCEIGVATSHRFPTPAPTRRLAFGTAITERLVRWASFVNLATLDVATFPDQTLEPIDGLVGLESLSIVHLPRVSNLGPLRYLQALRRLSLATLPSWDASGKVSQVDSLAPLAARPALVTLELFGVRPPDGRVDDLVRSTSLRLVPIRQYPPAEIDRLNQEMARRAMEGG
jgi:hypothetical protein